MKSIPYPVTDLGVFPAQGTNLTEEERQNSSQKSEWTKKKVSRNRTWYREFPRRRSFSHFPCSPYSWKGSDSVIKTRAFPLFIPHTIQGRRSRLSERFLYCWFRCRYWQFLLWSIPLPERDDHIYMLRKCLPLIDGRKTKPSPSLSPIR